MSYERRSKLFRFLETGFAFGAEAAETVCFLFLVSSIQNRNIFEMVHIAVVPAGQDRVCIFKAWLMSCRNCPAAGFFDDVQSKSIGIGPFLDIRNLRCGRAPIFDSESIQNSVAVFIITAGLLFCLLFGSDPAVCPGKSDLLNIMNTFVTVFHAGFDQIFDQICRHAEMIIKISDRIHICLCQSLTQILFRNE